MVQPDVKTMQPHVWCHYSEVVTFFDRQLVDIRSIAEVHDKLKINASMAKTSHFTMLVDRYSTD